MAETHRMTTTTAPGTRKRWGIPRRGEEGQTTGRSPDRDTPTNLVLRGPDLWLRDVQGAAARRGSGALC
ncbi:hypothetical protein INR49_018373 [Caranx melampygus]|nr:hypothetical protein INR49_018373 [Caranx melampygus]